MMTPSGSFRILGAVLLAVVAGGCGKSATEPESVPFFYEVCQPAGIQVSCSAILTDLRGGEARDVTSQAAWLVSDPGVGDFERPGSFTPRRRGEAGLSARYQRWETQEPDWFLVDPSLPAQRLYFLSGFVIDDSDGAHLPGATVEILDGYARGVRAVANEFGHYRIDQVLTGETFSVRASYPGYSPSTVSYRVDSPVGQPAGGNSPFLDFRLHRIPPAGP